jgi:hypothetical protein
LTEPPTLEPPWRPALYSGGRRLPVANQWGYNPHAAELLLPGRPAIFERPPPAAVRRACNYWARRIVWEERARRHPEMLTISRRAPGGVRVRSRLAGGRTPRGDFRALLQAALIAICEHSEVGSGLAGLWSGGRFIRSFSRHQWAARVNRPDGRRCSVWQWDRIVGRLQAAGLIMGRQRRLRDPETGGYIGQRRTVLLTHKFWQASRAWALRQEYLQKRLKGKRMATLAEERRRAAELAAAAGPLAIPEAPEASGRSSAEASLIAAIGWTPKRPWGVDVDDPPDD